MNDMNNPALFIPIMRGINNALENSEVAPPLDLIEHMSDCVVQELAAAGAAHEVLTNARADARTEEDEKYMTTADQMLRMDAARMVISVTEEGASIKDVVDAAQTLYDFLTGDNQPVGQPVDRFAEPAAEPTVETIDSAFRDIEEAFPGDGGKACTI